MGCLMDLRIVGGKVKVPERRPSASKTEKDSPSVPLNRQVEFDTLPVRSTHVVGEPVTESLETVGIGF